MFALVLINCFISLLYVFFVILSQNYLVNCSFLSCHALHSTIYASRKYFSLGKPIYKTIYSHFVISMKRLKTCPKLKYWKLAWTGKEKKKCYPVIKVAGRQTQIKPLAMFTGTGLLHGQRAVANVWQPFWDEQTSPPSMHSLHTLCTACLARTLTWLQSLPTASSYCFYCTVIHLFSQSCF